MPVGEDIPMLIPISIVLVVFVLFLIGLFSNFIDASDAIRISQESVLIKNSFINNMSNNLGMIDRQTLSSYSYCKNPASYMSSCNLSRLGIYGAKFKVGINLTDISSNTFWYWSNTKSFNETALVTETPILITNNSQTNLAKVVITVGK